jgi:hypothetical protein
LTWCQSATIFAYSGFNILWKELLCIFIPSNVYWVQLITFSYISRWWMMQFIFSARIPLFKQLHDLPLRCVWFCIWNWSSVSIWFAWFKYITQINENLGWRNALILTPATVKLSPWDICFH